MIGSKAIAAIAWSPDSASYDPKAIFEEQLKKCGVDYFDFYLLHNVYENSIQTYMDETWGILDYFKEQKRLGRIKHLGFSCHGNIDTLKEFLDYAGDAMEFCQLQINPRYLRLLGLSTLLFVIFTFLFGYTLPRCLGVFGTFTR